MHGLAHEEVEGFVNVIVRITETAGARYQRDNDQNCQVIGPKVLKGAARCDDPEP
jgi:hypothetical protein